LAFGGQIIEAYAKIIKLVDNYEVVINEIHKVNMVETPMNQRVTEI
jgi:hypothetical protein